MIEQRSLLYAGLLAAVLGAGGCGGGGGGGAPGPAPAPGGRGASTAQLIETDDAGNANAPQIAFDASSNALAVWQQSDGTRFNIWANRFH